MLHKLDQDWVAWYLHTAGTRAAAERAHAELAARRATNPADEHVTAGEWAAARAEADRAEDPYRKITEHDLAEHHLDQDVDTTHPVDNTVDRDEVDRAKTLVHPPETLDIRELTADEPAGADEDSVRVPGAAETADSVRRAERALAEMRARDAADAAREAEEARAAQLAQWHVEDHAAYGEDGRGDEHAAILEAVDHA